MSKHPSAPGQPELQFFTAAEVASILKMHRQVITRKLKSGEIAGYKLGKDWRISQAQLVDYLELHSNRAGGIISQELESRTKKNKSADSGARGALSSFINTLSGKRLSRGKRSGNAASLRNFSNRKLILSENQKFKGRLSHKRSES